MADAADDRLRLRKMKPDDRREMEAVLETYKNALGLE
ncbi:GapR family DNA-binding domain-containing protein [Novosphingobium sp. FKTRR1]|nr:GapR family DNA-binding domain-containing protein [Novosphingobium sp. FKTRR1]